MPFYDLNEFFKLSSALNYNLSAESLNRYNVLMYIIGGKRLHVDDAKDKEYKSIVMEVLSCLFNAYQKKKRRLGPMAVLHPLRATALLGHRIVVAALERHPVGFQILRARQVLGPGIARNQ